MTNACRRRLARVFGANSAPIPEPPPGGPGCAYPLDDDGTLAAAFSYDYAGPAVGADSQSMDYETTSANNAILSPDDPFGADRWSRPAAGTTVVEVAFTAGTSTGGGVLIISTAGGSLVNSGAVIDGVATDTIAFLVASDGTVTAEKNGSPATIAWLNDAPEDQKTVGATDKFAVALLLNPSGAGETAQMTLRTNASDYTGTYGADHYDPCDNPV